MKNFRFILAVGLLFVFASVARADIQVVAIDAAQPSAKFRETFAIKIDKVDSSGMWRVSVSYASQPDQKIDVTYADNSKQSYYSEGIVQGAALKIMGENDKEILRSPLHFQKAAGGRTIAELMIQEEMLPKLNIELYLPQVRDAFCYEINFKNVVLK